jgi:hypothetical protein
MLFPGDSGTISNRDKVIFLLSHQLCDSSVTLNDTLGTDTVGSYKKLPNGNYLLCFRDDIYAIDSDDSLSGEAGRMIELTPAGQVAGNYLYPGYLVDWKNVLSNNIALERKYIYYEYCAIYGTSYDLRYAYIFDKLTPRDRQTAIPIGFYDGMMCEFNKSLWGSIAINNDTCYVNYIYEMGSDCEGDTSLPKVKRDFTIQFYHQNGFWVADNVDSLRGLDSELDRDLDDLLSKR